MFVGIGLSSSVKHMFYMGFRLQYGLHRVAFVSIVYYRGLRVLPGVSQGFAGP